MFHYLSVRECLTEHLLGAGRWCTFSEVLKVLSRLAKGLPLRELLWDGTMRPKSKTCIFVITDRITGFSISSLVCDGQVTHQGGFLLFWY